VEQKTHRAAQLWWDNVTRRTGDICNGSDFIPTKGTGV